MGRHEESHTGGKQFLKKGVCGFSALGGCYIIICCRFVLHEYQITVTINRSKLSPSL